MSLSVITLVKGRERHLAHLLEGLRRSDCAPAELIIVDLNDAPLAAPAAGVPVVMARLATRGLPLAAARNLGAASASHEHLVFLDVDCIPGMGLIGALSDALQHHQALICADVRYLPDGVPRPGWTEADLLACGQSHPARTFPTAGLRLEPNPGLFWSLAFGVARTAFERLGGFNEAFTGYGAEDTDFGFRARAADLPLMFAGGALAFHQHHGVIDPPLQHFDDILSNAATFYALWGVWPMEGWLDAFERLGLITRTPTHILRHRGPTTAEVARARDADGRPF